MTDNTDPPANLQRWRASPVAIAVNGCLWLLLSALFFIPALAFASIQAGPSWLLAVVALPAIPLTLFALVVSKPTRTRLKGSAFAGVAVIVVGAVLAVSHDADSDASTGLALLTIGLGVVLSSATAFRAG